MQKVNYVLGWFILVTGMLTFLSAITFPYLGTTVDPKHHYIAITVLITASAILIYGGDDLLSKYWSMQDNLTHYAATLRAYGDVQSDIAELAYDLDNPDLDNANKQRLRVVYSHKSTKRDLIEKQLQVLEIKLYGATY